MKHKHGIDSWNVVCDAIVRFQLNSPSILVDIFSVQFEETREAKDTKNQTI